MAISRLSMPDNNANLALIRINEAIEKRLTSLDLGNCGLTELPDELFELTWLEELILSSEWESYSYEKKQWLRFSSINNFKPNDISSLNPKIAKLVKLKTLILRWVENITDLNPLKNLENLTYLHVAHCKISDLGPLSKLKNLRLLNIAATPVADLTPLQDLQNLEHVDIYKTQVSDLSPLKNIIEKGIPVGLYNYIYGINIQRYSLINPPKEIAEQGNEAILNYWKQNSRYVIFDKLKTQGSLRINTKVIFKEDYDIDLVIDSINSMSISDLDKIIEDNSIEEQSGYEELFEAKLIIVGEGATGKTTLFEKLKDKNHQIGNTPETHGINIYEGLPFKHKHIGDYTFHANLWDFGGQELQYMTHQFFLTPRALYVLMMDARRESPNLAYWFKIISLLGRDREDSTEKVRLLLVFNKRSNSTGTPPQYQDQLKYYEDSLDVQYLEVDFAENDYRFDNLQNAIQQSLVTLPIVKSQLPLLWKAVREDLREEAKTENYIDTKRFSAICSKHGITEEADQWLLSGYLHQLGSLLHFQNDKGLRRLVILSPQWAVDCVYTFLSDESIARNNGRFTETEFMTLLARRGYNRDDADVILQLMTKNNFDICYEATEGHYVAAQLLPDNAPPYAWFPKEVLQFRYQYPIMPKGLMSRLIVRLSDDIERDKESGEQIVWKKGVVLHIKLKEGDCRVRLREDDAESKAGLRQILIDVMGDRDARKYALRKERDTVDDLHKRWFRSIKADEMVPCCCSECKISETPQLYKLENLLKRRLKRPDTSCDVSGEDLMIQQLLEGVYDKGEIRDMENQGKYS